ncbi:prepilin-type N-terminal cleavage/methylation domain-containing protein [Omnitrophica bacterium]|nr:prepilin-type N-terminal cleavage/methylation domain-containing protein [Candidatus Omnitrophota bacterium]
MMKENSSGFTLLELLLAVTIFSVVAVALYSSFHAGIRILRRSEDVMKYHQDLRLVTDELSLDLRNALLAEIHGETEKGIAEETEAEEEEEPVYFFLGDGKSFTFVTLKDAFSEKGSRRQVCNIKYYFQGGETSRFMRSISYQSKGFATNQDEDEALLADVIDDIEVTYSYEGEDEDSPPIWLNYWEQEEKIPLGVKVKFKLKGLGRVREFTKTVFIDTGALGVQDEERLGTSVWSGG